MNRVSNAAHTAHLAVVPDTDDEPSEAELAVDEPSEAELAAIEAEMPLILANLAVIEAETALAARPGCVFAQRRHRRAVNRMLAVAAASGASVPVEVA